MKTLVGEVECNAKRLLLILMLISPLSGCNSSAPVNGRSPVVEASQPSSALVSAPRNWRISISSNPIDGTKTVTLQSDATNNRDASLVIRLKGKRLEAYVVTGDVVKDEEAPVRIKFDKEPPIKQIWGRSADYKAVFSPDPFGLITRLQRSSEFYIEYGPFERIPETITFDLAGLSSVMPQEITAVWKKKRDDLVALKARIALHVHECSRKNADGTPMFPGQWCWTDPDSDNYRVEFLPFPTKEAAAGNALEMAETGYAFKTPK